MNNLKSYTEYAVTTSTTDFVIGFDFNYGTDAVNVTVDGKPATEVGYTVVHLNSTTIRLTPAVTSGVVRLLRETDIDQSDHTYRPGAKFIAQTMDENFTQIRHAQQEVRDAFDYLEYNTLGVVEAAKEATDRANNVADEVEGLLDRELAHNDLHGRNTAGAHPASAIKDASGKSQQDLNAGLDSVSQLSNIQPTASKVRVFVKNFLQPNLTLTKPYFGGGGGDFEFVTGSADTPDNVRVFAGVGGVWKRVNWVKPTIYDAGIYDENLNNTVAFKALLAAAAGVFKGKKVIDLDGRKIKITDFIMYSNMTIQNGHLDFTGSTVISESNFSYAGLIIGENAPYRNLDPQVHTRYADLPVISNFGFDNVEFTSPVATNNIRRHIMTFYKWKNFELLRCKFNLNGAKAYKLVGSFANTNYTGLGLWDQPQPFGGYSSKAKIKFNEFVGTGYSQNTGSANIMSDTGQFAAVEDVEFSFNKSKNLMIGCHFDAFTRNSSSHHNEYEITDDMLGAFMNASTLDVIGVYVGQCGYGNSVYKNKIKNAIRHSVYVEAGSDIDVKNNKITHSAALVATTPSVAHGITIQANSITDSTNSSSFNKGCEDIEVSGNTIRGLRQGIVVSTAIADSARAVNIHDNDVKVSGNLAAIYTTNILDSNIHDNTCLGGIHLGRMLNCTVKNNSARNTSNYALFLTAGLKTETVVEGNDLYCDSGAVIYNSTTSGEVLNIFGGTIQQTAGAASIQNGVSAGAVRCYGFDNKVARKNFIHSQAVSIAAGATVLIQVDHVGVKTGWVANVSLNSMASLYTNNSINLILKSAARPDGVDILVTNAGSGVASFTPTFRIELDSFADTTFTN